MEPTSEEIKTIAMELLLNYPSISQPDAVRLAMNMLKGIQEVQKACMLKIYDDIFFDYLLNGKN